MSRSQRPESIEAALKDLLDYSYDDNLAQSNKEDVTPYFPLSFYDRHMDSRLLLKSVKSLPGIVQDLTRICNEAVSQMLDLETPDFSKYMAPARTPPLPFDSAYSVYTHYHERVHDATIGFVSKLYIHSQDRGWESCLGFESDENAFGNPDFAFTTVHGFSFSPRDPTKIDLPDEVFNDIEAGRQKIILDLAKRHPIFSTWQFFAMTPIAEELLDKMGPTSCFESLIPQTSGLAPFPPTSHLPDDSVLGFADLVAAFELSQRQLRPRTRKTDKAGGEHVLIIIPQRRKSPEVYTPKPEHFIQRAWNRAVVNDASFLLFHCGSYQRIGFRHRESQTLYLSDLIDTRDSRPPYGTIQMGFNLVGFQDAIGRQQVALQRAAESNKKRPSEDPPDDGPRRSKRLRAQKSGTSVDVIAPEERSVGSVREAVQAAMASCQVALVRLSYGHFRSPAPSAFVRVRPSCAPGSFDKNFKQPKRRTKYLPRECFSATITEPPLGHGAVGVMHRLTVEVESESRRLASDFLIKLAFTPKRQEKLRNEYAIYEHLAAAGDVEGVVPVHGLFEDAEASVLAVIMSDGGTSLRQREIDRGSTEELVVTEAESEAFKHALSSIHRAGVRHRDLRAENLLIDSGNQAYIIDFDRAEVTDRKNALAREMDGLRRMLIGRYYENCYSISDSGS